MSEAPNNTQLLDGAIAAKNPADLITGDARTHIGKDDQTAAQPPAKTTPEISPPESTPAAAAAPPAKMNPPSMSPHLSIRGELSDAK